ncbi:unnamed protein product [Anisakis simplex]|uniref:Uncharacterized protein n=1 Tax=Anisakis simplex TaxID=6269 RepID=A0A0M3K538_ANISI|nr:unnamed protein product [Anisakis simplex]
MTRQAAEFKGQFVGNFNCEYECRYDSVGAANTKSWGRRCGRCCCCCCPWGQCLFHHHRCCRRRRPWPPRPWPPYPEPPYDDSGEDNHSPWDDGEIGSSKGAGGRRKTPTS